jgi:hypothetical protein
MYSIFHLVETTDELEQDLITLADAKTELGVTGTSQDAAILARITRASKVITEHCNRQFALASAEETFVFGHHWRHQHHSHHARHEQALVLTLYPVVEIASISLDGIDLDASAFDVQPEEGMIRLIDCGRWHGRVIVSYTGGYLLPDAAPGALQQACIELVRQYSNASSSSASAGASGIRSITHGDETVTFDTSSSSSSSSKSSGLSQFIIDLLSPFRRPALA